MISELGLGDPWRLKNPIGKDYSFVSNVHHSYSRIDFFCLSQQYKYKVVDCHIEPITLSDHAPVMLNTDYKLLQILETKCLITDQCNSRAGFKTEFERIF